MKTLTAVQVLIKAKKLIEKGWCKEFAAVDAGGNPVFARDPAARRFCAYGALARAAPDQLSAPDQLFAYNVAVGWVESALPDANGIATFNDNQRTRRPVVALFNRAIKLAKADAKKV